MGSIRIFDWFSFTPLLAVDSRRGVHHDMSVERSAVDWLLIITGYSRILREVSGILGRPSSPVSMDAQDSSAQNFTRRRAVTI